MDAVFAEIIDEQNLAKYKSLTYKEASELKWKPIELIVDFRHEYVREDFRKTFKPTDFRATYKSNNFRVESSSENSLVPTNSGFLQKAPIASSDYLGICNNNFPTNFNYSSNFVFKSNFTASSSNFTFKSSDDINEYLKMHPDYLKMPKSMIAAIVAIVTSGLVLAGGIALCILTWGTSAPATLLCEAFFGFHY